MGTALARGVWVRFRVALLTVPAVLALAGCSGTSKPGASGPSNTDAATSPPPASSTQPEPGSTTPARHSPPVVSKDGPCPYFTTEFAQDTVGQHLARSTVQTTQPYHGCVLYRPDGAAAVRVAVTIFLTPLAAQQRAVSTLGASANPASGVGDRATVLVGGDGTRLVASKGRYLIQVWINQQSSLQAHDIALKVAGRIR
jgi:hypothetical protein